MCIERNGFVVSVSLFPPQSLMTDFDSKRKYGAATTKEFGGPITSYKGYVWVKVLGKRTTGVLKEPNMDRWKGPECVL